MVTEGTAGSVDDSPPPFARFGAAEAKFAMKYFPEEPYTEVNTSPDDTLPGASRAYFLKAGEGPRHVLFGQDAFVYLSIALIIAVWYFLYRTRAGLILRACGDNHVSAHALGYPVLRIRLLAVMFGGACAGLRPSRQPASLVHAAPAPPPAAGPRSNP